MSLIEKIDAEILCIKKILISGTFTEEVYGALMGKIQMAERIKEIILSEQKELCKYTLYDEDSNTYECSKCGALWILNADTPAENNMRFCPECGRPIQPTTSPHRSTTK